MVDFDYATPVPRRFELTAIAALILAMTAPASMFVFMWSPSIIIATAGMFSHPALAVILSVVSIFRIHLSSSTRRGLGFAITGILVATLWMLYLVYVFFIQHL